MLDLKFIRDNIAEVKANIANRFMKADADKVVQLFEERNASLQELEILRAKRNDNAGKMKAKLSPEERTVLVEEGRELKDKIAQLEKLVEQLDKDLRVEAMRIPNMAHPDAPIGREDNSNTEVKRVGSPTTFTFKPKDHVELGESLDIIDFEGGSKVAGPKFYFLKNEGVILELALTRYAIDLLMSCGFTPMITPDVAKEEILEGIGFNPRGEESNIYSLEGTGTCLVGTAEITLGGYLANTIIDKEQLPIKFAGLSHCFRREAGAAGQFSKGLYRVHQFTKVEMFVYCHPDDSDKFHQELRDIEERIFTELEIPFRVVDTCTGDLGAPAYRKWDLEAWMPGRGDNGDWGEVTSTSNCTDYQSRRLGIRFKDGANKTRFVHLLNGTALAMSRAIVALLENFQQADGSIRIPDKLVPYTGFKVIPSRKK